MDRKLLQCRVDVYSDCLSALMALNDPVCTHPLVWEIKGLLPRAKDVRLHWVKAHIGIKGNELADDAAKNAATHDSTVDKWETPDSRATLKRTLKEHLLYAWQNSWANDTTGRVTTLYYPKVSCRRLVTGMIASLATGHGRFPAYFHRFRYKVSNLCPCGQVRRRPLYLRMP